MAIVVPGVERANTLLIEVDCNALKLKTLTMKCDLINALRIGVCNT